MDLDDDGILVLPSRQQRSKANKSERRKTPPPTGYVDLQTKFAPNLGGVRVLPTLLGVPPAPPVPPARPAPPPAPTIDTHIAALEALITTIDWGIDPGRTSFRRDLTAVTTALAAALGVLPRATRTTKSTELTTRLTAAIAPLYTNTWTIQNHNTVQQWAAELHRRVLTRPFAKKINTTAVFINNHSVEPIDPVTENRVVSALASKAFNTHRSTQTNATAQTLQVRERFAMEQPETKFVLDSDLGTLIQHAKAAAARTPTVFANETFINLLCTKTMRARVAGFGDDKRTLVFYAKTVMELVKTPSFIPTADDQPDSMVSAKKLAVSIRAPAPPDVKKAIETLGRIAGTVNFNQGPLNVFLSLFDAAINSCKTEIQKLPQSEQTGAFDEAAKTTFNAVLTKLMAQWTPQTQNFVLAWATELKKRPITLPLGDVLIPGINKGLQLGAVEPIDQKDAQDRKMEYLFKKVFNKPQLEQNAHFAQVRTNYSMANLEVQRLLGISADQLLQFFAKGGSIGTPTLVDLLATKAMRAKVSGLPVEAVTLVFYGDTVLKLKADPRFTPKPADTPPDMGVAKQLAAKLRPAQQSSPKSTAEATDVFVALLASFDYSKPPDQAAVDAFKLQNANLLAVFKRETPQEKQTDALRLIFTKLVRIGLLSMFEKWNPSSEGLVEKWKDVFNTSVFTKKLATVMIPAILSIVHNKLEYVESVDANSTTDRMFIKVLDDLGLTNKQKNFNVELARVRTNYALANTDVQTTLTASEPELRQQIFASRLPKMETLADLVATREMRQLMSNFSEDKFHLVFYADSISNLKINPNTKLELNRIPPDLDRARRLAGVPSTTTAPETKTPQETLRESKLTEEKKQKREVDEVHQLTQQLGLLQNKLEALENEGKIKAGSKEANEFLSLQHLANNIDFKKSDLAKDQIAGLETRVNKLIANLQPEITKKKRRPAKWHARVIKQVKPGQVSMHFPTWWPRSGA